MKKYKKILITRTDRIGDVVLSTPIIKALKDNYPNSHISFMVRPYTLDLVRGNPYLDEVIVYDKYGRHKSALSTILFALDIRKKKFDLSIMLHPTNRVHLISFMAGIPERIGYNKKLGFLLTKKIEDKKYLGKKHELEYNFDLLKLIGINDVFYKMYVPIEYEDKQYIDSLLMSNGISYGDKIVAINPAASCPSKRWPRDRFAKVAQYLNKNYQTKIVLICSEKNNRICKKISSYLSKRQYFISSNLKLRQLAALLQRCSLLISNDSGPVHIAVAVKTPVISIFGRNQAGLSPTRWRPLGKNDTVLHKEVGCQQCLAHNCERDFLCLKAITVEDVVNAAKKYKQNISS